MINEIKTIHPHLSKMAYYYTKNKVDAQDLVQETLLKVLSKIHQYKIGTSFKNWTSTILRNTFINDYRRKKRMVIVNIENTSVYSESAINVGEFQVFKKEIDMILKTINPSHREVVELRKAGYSYKEISNKLNRPIGTIKSQIFSARKEVKKVYQKSMQYNGSPA